MPAAQRKKKEEKEKGRNFLRRDFFLKDGAGWLGRWASPDSAAVLCGVCGLTACLVQQVAFV